MSNFFLFVFDDNISSVGFFSHDLSVLTCPIELLYLPCDTLSGSCSYHLSFVLTPNSFQILAILRPALPCLTGSRAKRRTVNIQVNDLNIENITAGIM